MTPRARTTAVAERKPKAIDGRDRWPALAEVDGVLRATWPEHRVRFLLSDGRTVDVVTPRDDSDLRGALLDHLGVEAIMGHVRVEEVEQDG